MPGGTFLHGAARLLPEPERPQRTLPGRAEAHFLGGIEAAPKAVLPDGLGRRPDDAFGFGLGGIPRRTLAEPVRPENALAVRESLNTFRTSADRRGCSGAIKAPGPNGLERAGDGFLFFGCHKYLLMISV